MLDAYLLDNAQKIKKTILFFETLAQQNEIIANGLRIIDENLDENNNLTVAIVEEIAKNSLQVYLKGEVRDLSEEYAQMYKLHERDKMMADKIILNAQKFKTGFVAVGVQHLKGIIHHLQQAGWQAQESHCIPEESIQLVQTFKNKFLDKNAELAEKEKRKIQEVLLDNPLRLIHHMDDFLKIIKSERLSETMLASIFNSLVKQNMQVVFVDIQDLFADADISLSLYMKNIIFSEFLNQEHYKNCILQLLSLPVDKFNQTYRRILFEKISANLSQYVFINQIADLKALLSLSLEQLDAGKQEEIITAIRANLSKNSIAISAFELCALGPQMDKFSASKQELIMDILIHSASIVDILYYLPNSFLLPLDKFDATEREKLWQKVVSNISRVANTRLISTYELSQILELPIDKLSISKRQDLWKIIFSSRFQQTEIAKSWFHKQELLKLFKRTYLQDQFTDAMQNMLLDSLSEDELKEYLAHEKIINCKHTSSYLTHSHRLRVTPK